MSTQCSKYRCKKCRALLFTDEDLMCHEPNEEKVSFGYRRRGGGEECSSLFLKDKKEWMGPCENNDGKIICSCGTAIGLYFWSGNQCSCGRWITPALKINKSKVDKDVQFGMRNQRIPENTTK
ncbi:protein-tyrosine-phosphatase [Entamoeba marina]